MSARFIELSKCLIFASSHNQSQRMSEQVKRQLFEIVYPERVRAGIQEVVSIVSGAGLLPEINELKKGNLSIAEERLLGIKVCLLVLRNMKLDLERESGRYEGAYLGLCYINLGIGAKTFLQFMLYIRALLIFESNQYHRKLIHRANNAEDLGCFALTELDHGSFAKGILTEAVYDPKQRKFTINSKSESGMKFWIGSGAYTANMCILWAQLIVSGQNYGPHPFVIKLRDSDHQVLPGITIGDCGPKNAINCIDNGYMLFQDYQVPEASLLGKLGSIDHNGQYFSQIKSSTMRFGLHLSPLSTGRVLGSNVLVMAASALKILIDQLQNNSSKINPVSRLIMEAEAAVNLAQTVIYFIGAFSLARRYFQQAKNLTNPSNFMVAELHALSAGLKSKGSWFVGEVIDGCHRFLPNSPQLQILHHENDLNYTWEGDNNLLLQQTAKYIMKTLSDPKQAAFSSQIVPLKFMFQNQNFQNTHLQSYNSKLNQIYLRDILRKNVESFSNYLSREHPPDVQNDIWNELQPFYGREVSLSFGDLFFLQESSFSLQSLNPASFSFKILAACQNLWVMSILKKHKYSTQRFRCSLEEASSKYMVIVKENFKQILDSVIPCPALN